MYCCTHESRLHKTPPQILYSGVEWNQPTAFCPGDSTVTPRLPHPQWLWLPLQKDLNQGCEICAVRVQTWGVYGCRRRGGVVVLVVVVVVVPPAGGGIGSPRAAVPMLQGNQDGWEGAVARHQLRRQEVDEVIQRREHLLATTATTATTAHSRRCQQRVGSVLQARARRARPFGKHHARHVHMHMRAVPRTRRGGRNTVLVPETIRDESPREKKRQAGEEEEETEKEEGGGRENTRGGEEREAGGGGGGAREGRGRGVTYGGALHVEGAVRVVPYQAVPHGGLAHRRLTHPTAAHPTAAHINRSTHARRFRCTALPWLARCHGVGGLVRSVTGPVGQPQPQSHLSHTHNHNHARPHGRTEPPA